MKPHLPNTTILLVLGAAAALRAQEPAAASLAETNLDPTAAETIVVTGKAENLLGVAPSATAGQANNAELSERPVLRRGELLEAVPGVVITQHSGGGKANQYFLRGFNLDHGTDFAVSLDGMPVNFRTHAHGQGYADLNFLIPEFTERLDYFKGPYFAEHGDLSTAGGANYSLFRELTRGLAGTTVGENEYYRGVLGDSFALGDGVLTLGGEYTHDNGPWTRPQEYERVNGLVRYHQGDDDEFLTLTALGYRGDWEATDQIPERAVRSGGLDRFGNLDDTAGGDSSRYSLQLAAQKEHGGGVTHLDAWAGYYDLDLFSNFTYLLNDPLRGDQFEQVESRWFAGAHLWHRRESELFGLPLANTFGAQTRNDWIDGIGLHLTDGRERFATVREDDVYEGSYSLYADSEARLNDWARAGLGARADLFRFDVASDDPRNSGGDWDGIASPKARLIFGPWAETEFYVNGGLGFHSNDARGVTIARDPLTGESVDPVDPLVRTKGAEVGLRSQLIPDVTATVALWWLESNSEFVYVGDAGTTEAGPGSKRHGLETAVYWRPRDWFTADVEYAWSQAGFTDGPASLREIPNALEHMASGGITLGREQGLYGALRGRFFSDYPLEESGKVRGDSSFLVNARVGYRWSDHWDLAVDVLNLFDREDNDIEYFYESRLAGEPAAGFEDVHFHPAEPRQVRVSMTYRW